ncbi:MAG: DNA-directed RNA polymerase subunit beta' [Clostridia bacterium]|nr:DNA-directed RNA polymerase subunit beta' [Clostridia bacterium]
MDKKPFEAIKIGLASPDQIREWSYGEVKKPETINYRTLKPEKDGLYCERIFGPQKDLECHCGKYKKIRYKGKICEKCGVEVTKKEVRRERMGHIELVAPVSHIWYFKGIPSRMGLILDISPRDLEKVLYFAKYIVIDPGDTELTKNQILSDKEYLDMVEKYDDEFKAGMGAEAIKELLSEVDVDELCKQLREELDGASGQKKTRLLKRLEVAKAFKQSGNRPEWMIMDVIPVIPPDIRPMVQLDGGRFATSDLNDLYRRVINRNNRLKRLLELNAPEIIVRNEKRMLQEAVDALIDNGRRGRPVTGPNNRALKSLSDMLKGKQGRFRQNLLGKRVDYSGRSVIVVGPELKLYQCGLPKEMALELFKPFVMKNLVENGLSSNMKSAKKMVERAKTEVWDALEKVIKDHPVMLNRAPTLHRLGIQAFEPVLVEGRAIKLHPLVCTAFNADFDGDQMAVHVPLSAEAQAEARLLMLAANNLLKPSDGKPVAVPTQDMILGSYYLTMVKDGEPGEGKVFRDVDEATMAYDEGDITLHAKIKIRMTKEVNGEMVTKLVPTTLGRVIFNNPIPQDLGFVDRTDPENAFKLEVDFLVKKGGLGKIIDKCIKVHGVTIAAEMLDKIKAQGFKYSTRSGITVAVCDAKIPESKKDLLASAEEQVDVINSYYNMGLYSADERSRAVIKVWEETTNAVSSGILESLGEYNPIYMMVDSGARGSKAQLRQLAGMRGLIANTAGKTIEVPIRANYREGLNVLEYFISSRGARKGLADTALRTADSGYLTRRLVDVSQDVIIREEDCHCHEGLEVYDITEGKEMIETLSERLTGRYLLEDFYDEDGNLVASKDEMITEEKAKVVADMVNARENPADRRIKIRSLLTCDSEHGVCIKCYGANLATGDPVTVGEAVGIIAAQSIGEPGTQLTMRTFHTGGVASSQDITQGLPRVEELFEARKPKTLAILAEIDGILSFREIKGNEHIVITDHENGDERAYMIPYGFHKTFNSETDENGNPIFVKKGTALTDGAPNPNDILAINGVDAVHDYLIKEVQRTYRMQGVDINDKHIEVIVRQMMRKLRVEDEGTTDLLPGATTDKREFNAENEKARLRAEETGETFIPATCAPVLLGITKASLATDSFLSAASFQETTRVLTDAAIKGKVDPLMGLKENVIIGKLLPSGTGMKCYSEVELQKSIADLVSTEA